MKDTLIAYISDTARWVAAFRAEESKRSDAEFRDELAEKLAGEKGYGALRATPHPEAMSFALVARTTAIDQLIAMAIDRGVDTVMNLAAGLDTRPYRMIFRPIYAGLK